MTQSILVAKTTDGIQVAFTEPVLTVGTKAGTRLSLTEETARLLAHRLEQYLAGQATLAADEVRGPGMYAAGNMQPTPASAKVDTNGPWGQGNQEPLGRIPQRQPETGDRLMPEVPADDRLRYLTDQGLDLHIQARTTSGEQR